MIDREKVIKQLDEIGHYFFDIYRKAEDKEECCLALDRADVVANAIALLKEQEERIKFLEKWTAYLEGGDPYEGKGVLIMIDYTRDDVIEALEYLLSPVCTETQFDYCDEIRAAIAFLKEKEPSVLEYSEIEKHPLVWLEDNDKEDVIPALFLQYNGWNVEFSVQAPDQFVDTIFRDAVVVTFKEMYGTTWRAWTSLPSPEQMRDTPWE